MIRKADINDFEQIRRIYRKTLSNHRFISKETHLSGINGGKVFVYVHSGEVVAYVNMGRNNTIKEMAVLPEYQRQGIGTKLLDFLKENCDNLWVNTSQAVEFYRKHGFDIVDGYRSKRKGVEMKVLFWANKKLLGVV